MLSKDVIPSTPNAFPAFIARKLDALGSIPKKADLNALRELLEVDQEQRVVSDEEIQRLRNLEEKMLEDQNKYKKLAKDVKKFEKCSIGFFLFFTMPWLLCKDALKSYLDEESRVILLLNTWPINLIAVAIYLYCLYGSHLRLRFGSSKPVEYKVFKNEGFYWQHSMNSTEIQSKQKALVNSWDEILEDPPILSLLSFIASFANIIFLAGRFVFIHDFIARNSALFFSFSVFTQPFLIYYLFGYIFSFLFFVLFVVQAGRTMNHREKVSPTNRSY